MSRAHEEEEELTVGLEGKDRRVTHFEVRERERKENLRERERERGGEANEGERRN